MHPDFRRGARKRTGDEDRKGDDDDIRSHTRRWQPVKAYGDGWEKSKSERRRRENGLNSTPFFDS